MSVSEHVNNHPSLAQMHATLNGNRINKRLMVAVWVDAAIKMYSTGNFMKTKKLEVKSWLEETPLFNKATDL
ncbi:hypothetical protein IT774_04225 [Salinimonas marina]|uniref:Uncharacterized protein n=1 Tax=Salinimonas marina TaxID=2785918 RepID=A0A7S9DYV6_9ALTE|nr:hypothetical protein [Salinimonas marina]QPG06405.1 hypothetical protein IT774_04225 [Salinimonas marina]